MPNPLIIKMQEIVDHNKDAGILTKADQAGERVRFFSKNGPKIARISELGEGANQFIHNANRNYTSGTLKPPFSEQNIGQIYKQFKDLNKDLQGDPAGTDADKVRHQEWNAFWDKQVKDFPDLAAKLATVQQEVLAAYRFKTLSLTAFKPHAKSTQQDEARVQDFLQEVNKRMRAGLNEAAALEDLTSKFSDRLTQGLDSMLARMVVQLNNKDWNGFSQSFSQLQTDKAFEFLGLKAQTLLFDAIAKTPLLVAKLPLILENDNPCKVFIEAFPDSGKRKQLLESALASVKTGKQYPHSHGLFDQLMGKKTTNTQDQHINLLTKLISAEKNTGLSQAAVLQVNQLASILDSKHDTKHAMPDAADDNAPLTRPRAKQVVLSQFDQPKIPIPADKSAEPDIAIIPQKPADLNNQAPRHK
jgi:hypothetical protein